jgi:hypothetical protein
MVFTLASPHESPFRLPRGAAGLNIARCNLSMPDPESPESEPTAPAPAEAESVPVHVPPRERAPREGVPREIGGRESGLEPTRYGDWEKNGRCIDF